MTNRATSFGEFDILWSEPFRWLVSKVKIYALAAVIAGTSFVVGAAIYAYVWLPSRPAPEEPITPQIHDMEVPNSGGAVDKVPKLPVDIMKRDLPTGELLMSNRSNTISVGELEALKVELTGSKLVSANGKEFGTFVDFVFPKDGGESTSGASFSTLIDMSSNTTFDSHSKTVFAVIRANIDVNPTPEKQTDKWILIPLSAKVVATDTSSVPIAQGDKEEPDQWKN